MMEDNTRFEKITEEIINMDIFQQRKFLYFLLGATKEAFSKPVINKTDILLTYENAIKYFGSTKKDVDNK